MVYALAPSAHVALHPEAAAAAARPRLCRRTAHARRSPRRDGLLPALSPLAGRWDVWRGRVRAPLPLVPPPLCGVLKAAPQDPDAPVRAQRLALLTHESLGVLPAGGRGSGRWRWRWHRVGVGLAAPFHQRQRGVCVLCCVVSCACVCVCVGIWVWVCVGVCECVGCAYVCVFVWKRP